jgi:D-arabinitol dehydrogenase (NADP+)
LIGSYAQTHCFDRAVKFLELGLVNVQEPVTTHYDLDHNGDMLEKMSTARQHIKIIVHPAQD